MNKRGIVISPRYEFGEETISITGSPEEEDLRWFLLYWDEIDYPINNLISTGTGAHEQFLIEAGVMSRTEIRVSNFSGDIRQGYLLAQAEALKINNQKEPGIWSMGQTGSSTLSLPPEVSHETQAIEIELYNLLPVPSNEVSFEDILLFKERRNDELLALRSAMDQLYLAVSDSSDIPRAKAAALNELERTLRDLHKVTNESWNSRVLSSLKVELSLTNALAGFAWGEAAAVAAEWGVTSLDIPAYIGGALGVVGSTVKVDLSSTLTVNGLPPELKDFAYLQNMERELT